MKTYINLFFLIILSINLYAQNSQDISYKNESHLKYEKFDKQGNYQNNLPVGKWIDISKSGVIYREYYFDKTGKPSGIWSFNFPDGTIRKQIEYIDNNIVRIKRFNLGGSNFFEIKLNQTIEDSIYKQFQALEEELFYYQNTTMQIKVDGYDARSYSYHFDPYVATKNFLDFFSNSKTDCEIDLWNTEGKHWRKWSYSNGEIIEIYYTYSKKNNLVSQTEYRNNKKFKKTTFNIDGSIKK